MTKKEFILEIIAWNIKFFGCLYAVIFNDVTVLACCLICSGCVEKMNYKHKDLK